MGLIWCECFFIETYIACVSSKHQRMQRVKMKQMLEIITLLRNKIMLNTFSECEGAVFVFPVGEIQKSTN